MKKILIGITASFLLIDAQAQNQSDLFRYSYQNITGSARTLGLAGAWGAVGADLSAGSNNPAGLGLYRRNEVMGSMAVTSTGSSAAFMGNTTSDSRTGFNIPNIGMAFTWLDQYKGRDKRSGLVSATFAFGMNRMSDFQTNTRYSGNVSNTTVGDYFATKANGKDSAGFWDSNLDNDLYAQAWRTVLIDNYNSPTQYRSRMGLWNDPNYTMLQSQNIQTRGRINEWYFGSGVNVANFIYLGASLVIKDLKFSTTNYYHETVVSKSDSGNTYQGAEVTQTFNTKGSGVGGKFGVIVRPVDFIKLGFSYHTPVRMNLTDYYQNSLTVYNTNGKSYNEPGSDQFFYKYQVITPASITLSGAVTIGKSAVIAVDYQRIDYGKARLQDIDGSNYFAVANYNNQLIYGIVSNIRAGAEFNLSDFRLRAGYAILGNPLVQNPATAKNDLSKQVFSAGFGYVYNKQLFIDFAVSDRVGKDYITAYEGNTSAVNTMHTLNFVVGGGYRF